MKSRKTLKGHMGNTGNKINILLGTDIYILYSITQLQKLHFSKTIQNVRSRKIRFRLIISNDVRIY